MKTATASRARVSQQRLNQIKVHAVLQDSRDDYDYGHTG